MKDPPPRQPSQNDFNQHRESETSDESLLNQFRSGDEEAAARLYHKYAPRLRAFVQARTSPSLAARLDAEDILQSVFRSFFRAAAVDLYQVPDGGSLWKLLLTLALNKVRAQAVFHHAAKRDVNHTTPLNEDQLDQALQVRDDLNQTLFQIVFDEAVAQLPPHQREIVELRLRGYEVEAIAQQVRRSKRTVERYLQRALSQLAFQFENE